VTSCARRRLLRPRTALAFALDMPPTLPAPAALALGRWPSGIAERAGLGDRRFLNILLLRGLAAYFELKGSPEVQTVRAALAKLEACEDRDHLKSALARLVKSECAFCDDELR
jgi:hypothetical protein